MLTRALRTPSSASISSQHFNIQPTLSSTLLSAGSIGSLAHEELFTHDSVHGNEQVCVETIERAAESTDTNEDLLFGCEGCDDDEIGPSTVISSSRSIGYAPSSSQDTAAELSRHQESPFAVAKGPQHTHYGMPVSQPDRFIQHSSSLVCPPIAQSCPKPIVMPRKCRHSSLPHEQDELSVFVPPHEIVASSLMDPTNAPESLCCKGSAALRLRSGVLRRTGYMDGHTETMRTTISSSFRP